MPQVPEDAPPRRKSNIAVGDAPPKFVPPRSSSTDHEKDTQRAEYLTKLDKTLDRLRGSQADDTEKGFRKGTVEELRKAADAEVELEHRRTKGAASEASGDAAAISREDIALVDEEGNGGLKVVNRNYGKINNARSDDSDADSTSAESEDSDGDLDMTGALVSRSESMCDNCTVQ